MPTPRDAVRAARNAQFRRAIRMGINLDNERQKPGSNQRTLAHAAKRLINDAVPRTDREDLQTDAPPAGAFNSVNTTFTLSAPVQGTNIVVVFGHVSGATSLPLRRTDNNPPGPGEFYFNINAPTVIVTGDAPDAADMLVAVYKTVR